MFKGKEKEILNGQSHPVLDRASESDLVLAVPAAGGVHVDLGERRVEIKGVSKFVLDLVLDLDMELLFSMGDLQEKAAAVQEKLAEIGNVELSMKDGGEHLKLAQEAARMSRAQDDLRYDFKLKKIQLIVLDYDNPEWKKNSEKPTPEQLEEAISLDELRKFAAKPEVERFIDVFYQLHDIENTKGKDDRPGTKSPEETTVSPGRDSGAQ